MCCQRSISESKSVAFGIPQGKILGPLLFILYINDLPNCLEIRSLKCTPMIRTWHLQVITLILSSKNWIKISSVSVIQGNWLVANKLTLNKSKTEFSLVIGSRQRLGTFDRSPSLKINNVLIQQVGSTKSLLSWGARRRASNMEYAYIPYI